MDSDHELLLGIAFALIAIIYSFITIKKSNPTEPDLQSGKPQSKSKSNKKSKNNSKNSKKSSKSSSSNSSNNNSSAVDTSEPNSSKTSPERKETPVSKVSNVVSQHQQSSSTSASSSRKSSLVPSTAADPIIPESIQEEIAQGDQGSNQTNQININQASTQIQKLIKQVKPEQLPTLLEKLKLIDNDSHKEVKKEKSTLEKKLARAEKESSKNAQQNTDLNKNLKLYQRELETLKSQQKTVEDRARNEVRKEVEKLVEENNGLKAANSGLQKLQKDHEKIVAIKETEIMNAKMAKQNLETLNRTLSVAMRTQTTDKIIEDSRIKKEMQLEIEQQLAKDSASNNWSQENEDELNNLRVENHQLNEALVKANQILVESQSNVEAWKEQAGINENALLVNAEVLKESQVKLEEAKVEKESSLERLLQFEKQVEDLVLEKNLVEEKLIDATNVQESMIEKREQSIASKEEQIKSMEEQLKAMQEASAQQVANANKIATDHDKLEKEIFELKGMLASKDQEISDLQELQKKSINDQSAKVDLAAQNQITSLEASLATTTDQLNQKEQEISNYKIKISEITNQNNQELDEIKNESQKKTLKIQTISEHLFNIEDEINNQELKWSSKCSSLEAKVEEYSKSLEDVKGLNQNWEKLSENAKNEITVLQAQLDEKNGCVELLEKKALEKDELLKSFQQQITTIKSSNESLNLSYTSEITSLKSQIQSLVEKSAKTFIINEQQHQQSQTTSESCTSANQPLSLNLPDEQAKIFVSSSDDKSDSIIDQKNSPKSEANVSPSGSNSDWIMLNDDNDKSNPMISSISTGKHDDTESVSDSGSVSGSSSSGSNSSSNDIGTSV